MKKLCSRIGRIVHFEKVSFDWTAAGECLLRSQSTETVKGERVDSLHGKLHLKLPFVLKIILGMLVSNKNVRPIVIVGFLAVLSLTL